MSEGILYLVSIGPGDVDHMTPAARRALSDAEVVIGYRLYVDQVRDLLHPGQEVQAAAMGTERRRAEEAIHLAAAGRRVAVLSSGDVGIYAMAAPVFEALAARGWDGIRPEVVVYPGVSAVQAAAARVGAPLNHDFCTISLSDLLTPWEVIERRVHAAAWGDFVIALYNPRSRKRHWHLSRALEIIRQYRGEDTPVAFVRNATRGDESVHLTTLAGADPTQADMFTLVLIGNRETFTLAGRMVTPRGYTLPAGSGMPPEENRTAEVGPVYPIALTRLQGARVVVVGGGPVAERKVHGLLDVGARVTVVSPDATPRLRAWAKAGRITWERRPYRDGDLAGARLAFAATNRREVNAQVARAAAALGILCNVADVREEGNFHVPAVYRKGSITLAVSTGGRSPTRARAVRDALARALETIIEDEV